MRNLIINVTDRDIGPRNDPYSAVIIKVVKGQRSAERYYDGLGSNRLVLIEGEQTIREYSWFDKFRGQDVVQDTKARILFRRHVGIEPEEAKDEFDRTWTSDPMGHPSNYI